jgi:hypothetical protein
VQTSLPLTRLHHAVHTQSLALAHANVDAADNVVLSTW